MVFCPEMTIPALTRGERAAFFAAKARDARDHANRALDPHVCQTWLDIADSWEFLADSVMRLPESESAKD